MPLRKRTTEPAQFCHWYQNLRKIDARSNATFRPKFSVLTPSWVFPEGYGIQHALLRLVEASKKTMNNGGVAGAVLTDLSKVFDCLNHEILNAKLNAYGFSRSTLLLIHSYLTDRK